MRFNVATRTLKNSSKLFENIPRKRTRSRRGTVASAASCKTLALNESQLMSLTIVFRLLETADEYFPYYRKRHAFWRIYGLDLPDEVLKKVYYM